MNTQIYYTIEHGNGTLVPKNGITKFKNEEQATNYAKTFKENPKLRNEEMKDENVIYWQVQTYEIVRHIVVTEIISLI